MSLEKFYQRFILDERLIQETGFNPYYWQISSGLDDPVIIGGRKFINLASNNYLGLAGDPRVKDAITKAVKKYGASLCGTPIATGCIDLYKRLEERLAEFVKLEDAVIFPSGYQANNGLFRAIADKDDLVIIDHFAHSSLVEGVRSVGCKIRPFLHNNVNHLEDILKKAKGHRQMFVVTESVFSAEGSMAPFEEIVAICNKYGAVPVVDDSHGIGTIGKRGQGILEEKAIADYPGIYTASLGKALANAGGFIAGKKVVMDYLRYYCSHLVYSTALVPGVLGGVEKVLDIIESEFENLRRKMWRYKDAIHQVLVEAGFTVDSRETPINSILSGNSKETIFLAKKFYENNIFVTPFIYPAVPAKEGRVRLIAGANLKEKSIKTVVEVIKGTTPKERLGQTG